MKKPYILLALLLVSILVVAGCGQNAGPEQVAPPNAPESETSNADTSSDTDKLNIVATTFPLYDWTREILGENAEGVELTLLLDSKVDLHNYQPSVDDIVKIASCDLFIYVGGESDAWVNDVLKNVENKDLVVIKLIEVLKNATGTDARDLDHKHDGHDDHLHENSEDHSHDYDEHVWLSLKNARIFSTAIAETLCSLDPGNAEVYQENLVAYVDRIEMLDQKYRNLVDAGETKALVFGDRFPFSHLAEDYRLTCYAAFEGCSAESEAGFETIIFLAGKIDSLALEYIIVTESSDQALAKTIRDNTQAKNQEIIVMDSMQSMTSSDLSKGTTYLSVMEDNLETLTIALGGNFG
jgi:ABC-type metal ion transport system, periplasmic component/surface adhesin